MKLEVTSTTKRIDRDHLPTGHWFEEDGSCWQAEVCEQHPLTGRDWRWSPLNFKAFAKEEPQGEMLPHYPFAPNLNHA
jgi:hypothetical protein